jgi:hypothetical protein
VVGPLGAVKVFSPRLRQQAQAADVAAIDRSETRTVLCWFRGLYGRYRRKFYLYYLDLAPGGPVLRKHLLFWVRERIPITEGLISASLRPPANRQEAFRIGASGMYGSGGPLEVVGNQIISCRTTEGVLEFAVKGTDVPLVLHYIANRVRAQDA